jgi:hypothetical protein
VGQVIVEFAAGSWGCWQRRDAEGFTDDWFRMVMWVIQMRLCSGWWTREDVVSRCQGFQCPISEVEDAVWHLGMHKCVYEGLRTEKKNEADPKFS